MTLNELQRMTREQRVAYYAQRVEAGLALWEEVVVDYSAVKNGKVLCTSCGRAAGGSKGKSLPGLDRAGNMLLCWSCLARYGVPPLWKIPLVINRD
jgi:hypothetical protein